MSKSMKENILGLVAIVVLVILMVCVVIRDIDKDVERECGKIWNENGSELCKEFWKDKGIHE